MAQSTARSHHIDLYGPACKSKYAAGSHARATAVARELFGRQTRLFRGLGAARGTKNAQSAARSHQIDLCGPACKSKYAAGRPAKTSSSCEGAILPANSSFSRVGSRKRHEKRVAGHNLLHTRMPLTSMVLPANLNMQLGALREQQRLWDNCFAEKRKLRDPENVCRLRKSTHALTVQNARCKM